MISDFGKRINPVDWTYPQVYEFQKLIDQGKKFDEAAKQPDCQDETKMDWFQKILDRLDKIEKKVDALQEGEIAS